MSKPRLRLFTTGRCPHCRQLKEFLQQRKVPFLEQDIERNQRAFAEFQQNGGRSVPLLLIGERKISGFDAKRIEQALRDAGLL